jgi:hypothetical protein
MTLRGEFVKRFHPLGYSTYAPDKQNKGVVHDNGDSAALA